MNCHEDNKGNKGNHKHSQLKHMLHMILCCGLPIIIIIFLPIITRFSPNAGRVLGWIAPFLCPIMMISMIAMMFNHNKKSSCCDNSNNDNNKSMELDKPTE